MYESTNRPTPTLRIGEENPAIRASTLATFEEVTTVPETTCPPRATGVLKDIERICGGAFGGSEIGLTAAPAGAIVPAATGCCRTGAAVAESAGAAEGEDGGPGAAEPAGAAGIAAGALETESALTGEGVGAGLVAGCTAAVETGVGAAAIWETGCVGTRLGRMWLYHSQATNAQKNRRTAASAATPPNFLIGM